MQKKLQQEHHRNIFNLPIPLLQLKKNGSGDGQTQLWKKTAATKPFSNFPLWKKNLTVEIVLSTFEEALFFEKCPKHDFAAHDIDQVARLFKSM